MTTDPDPQPLAADCEQLRLSLLANPLAPIWTLDAAEARTTHIELTLAARAAWLPPLEQLAVTVEELAGLGPRPEMRRYRKDDVASSTALLWFHGGGWVLGDLDTTDAPARTACDATGWEVLAVDYRCAPADRFPAAALDALEAADWALDNYDRVIVGGDSAGGNLAGVVAQQRGAHPGLVGQVLVYPVVDPTMAYASYAEFVEGPFLSRRDMEWFFDEYVPNEEDRTSPLVDLIHDFDSRGVAPLPAVVLTVGHDPLRDEGVAYARLLADSGAPTVWIHAPELYHGAFSNSGYLPSAAARVSELWSAAQRLLG